MLNGRLVAEPDLVLSGIRISIWDEMFLYCGIHGIKEPRHFSKPNISMSCIVDLPSATIYLTGARLQRGKRKRR